MTLKDLAVTMGIAGYLVGSLMTARQLGASNTVMAIVMFGNLIGFFALFVVSTYKHDKARAQQMVRYVEQNGFRSDADTDAFVNTAIQYSLFRKGESRRVTNLIRGQRGPHSFAVCDYKYTTGQRSTFSIEKVTLCIVDLAHPGMPHFFARRRHRVGDLLRMSEATDIVFDDDRPFSRAFVLRSRSAVAEIRRLFSPSMRSVFTGLATKNLEVEGMDGSLLLHYGECLDVVKVDGLIEDALTLARCLG